MRLSFPIILLICCAFLLIGQAMYENDIETSGEENLDNLTIILEQSFRINYSLSEEIYNFTNNSDNNLEQVRLNRISKVIGSFADFLITFMFESVKYLIEYGYTHPEYDFEFYMQFLKWYLICIVIIMFIPLLIPGIALIVVIIIGLVKLIKKIINRYKK